MVTFFLMLVEFIQKQHRELRELFLQHQEALLQARFEAASAALQAFRPRLSAHMALEEQYLFPAFAGIDRKSRWDAGLYAREHEKINQMYGNIAGELQRLSEEPGKDSAQRRNIIVLLDKEKTFKGLLEHHEDREEEALLRELDEQLPEKDREELVSRLSVAGGG